MSRLSSSSSSSSLKCNETFIVELNCVQILRQTLFKSNPSHTQPNSHTLSIVHVAHPPAPLHASPTIWQWMAQMCHHHIVYTCTHLSHLHIITHYYRHFGNCSPCFRCFSDVFATWCHDERVSSFVWQMPWRNCSRHISCVCVSVWPPTAERKKENAKLGVDSADEILNSSSIRFISTKHSAQTGRVSEFNSTYFWFRLMMMALKIELCWSAAVRRWFVDLIGSDFANFDSKQSQIASINSSNRTWFARKKKNLNEIQMIIDFQTFIPPKVQRRRKLAGQNGDARRLWLAEW